MFKIKLMLNIKMFALFKRLVFLLWANCVDRMATEGRFIPSRGFSGSHTGTCTYGVRQDSRPGQVSKVGGRLKGRAL